MVPHLHFKVFNIAEAARPVRKMKRLAGAKPRWGIKNGGGHCLTQQRSCACFMCRWQINEDQGDFF